MLIFRKLLKKKPVKAEITAPNVAMSNGAGKAFVFDRCRYRDK
jgi:hypothetical protein